MRNTGHPVSLPIGPVLGPGFLRPRGLGVTIQGAQQLQADTKAQCLQQGWTWVLDPNPDPAVAATVGPIGTCVDPAVVSQPGFDPGAYFANITFAAAGNPPTLPVPTQALTVSSPGQTPPPPTSSYGPPPSPPCSTLDLVVDQNRFLAVALLVGLFAWFGGFR
jgi:hypothetical protein